MALLLRQLRAAGQRSTGPGSTSLGRLFAICAAVAFAALMSPAADAQTSLSLSPAVIMASGTYGQSMTQTLTINNQTSAVFDFRMLAEDIVVKDGKRVFLPAGQAEGSIAATAVFVPEEIIAPPKTSQSVTVTLTIPAHTDIRAIAAVFHADSAKDPKTGTVGLVASMGTLITFNLGNDLAVTPAPVEVTAPTATTNLTFGETLQNTGSEPVIPKGVAAILNSENHLVGKVPFAQQRLLPGEKLPFRAEFSDQLKPGAYHVMCTFGFAGHTATQQANFNIP
jgi:hypothetical protein